MIFTIGVLIFLFFEYLLITFTYLELNWFYHVIEWPREGRFLFAVVTCFFSILLNAIFYDIVSSRRRRK